MQRMNQLIAILTIFSLISCVSKKGVDICGTHLLSEKEWIDSKISKIQTTGIADTTMAFVSVHILGISIKNGSTFIDTLRIAAIEFNQIGDSLSTGTIAEIDGTYKIILDAGYYDVRISYIGYNSLLINNFSLEIGEIKEFNVTLGQGHGTTEYFMTGKNTYVRKREPKKKKIYE